MPNQHSKIGSKPLEGAVFDTAVLEEIMAGADDSEMRIRSAMKAIAELGLAPEEAEAVFNVKLPPVG